MSLHRLRRQGLGAVLDDLTNIRRVLFRHAIRLSMLKLPVVRRNIQMPRSRIMMTRSRELMRKRGTLGSQWERNSHHPGFLQLLMLEDSLAYWQH